MARLFTFYLIVVLTVLWSPIHGQNLIDNPDFENWDCSSYNSNYSGIDDDFSQNDWANPKMGINPNKHSKAIQGCTRTAFASIVPPSGIKMQKLEYWFENYSILKDKTVSSYSVNQLSASLNVGFTYNYSFWINIKNLDEFKPEKIGLMFSESQPSITKMKKGSNLYDYGNSEFALLDNTVQSQLVNETWLHVQGQFDCTKSNLSYMTVGHFERVETVDVCAIFIDNFALEELGPTEEYVCDPTVLIQDKVYTSKQVIGAQNDFRTGFNVGAGGSTGNVIVKPHQKVVNKAGNSVTLEPGFETEPGADFLAYIAPCEESPCDEAPPTGLATRTFDFCGSAGGQIYSDFTFNTGGNFSWSPSTYLGNPSSATPTFTPPAGNGVQTYTVTYTNFCGVSATQQVMVNYSNLTTAPSLTFSNQFVDEYNFEMDVQVSSNNSEWLEINIMEKPSATVVYTTGQLNEGVDYTNGLFSFEAPLYSLTSVCKDYEVEVKTKNLCNNTIASDVFDWDRSTYCSPKPQLVNTPTNFSPNGDGVDDEYCIEVCGADEYEVIFKDNFNTPVFSSGKQPIDNSEMCIWDGGTAPSGNYSVEITLFSCGESHVQSPISITLAR